MKAGGAAFRIAAPTGNDRISEPSVAALALITVQSQAARDSLWF